MAEREYRKRTIEAPPWVPRTELGKKVAAGLVTSIDEVLKSGKPILETQIVDALLPDLREEVLDVTNTQRMTSYGRKMTMRAIVIIGNQRGYVGAGVGKSAEARDAIQEAITDAKKNIVKVMLGCGSWECGCGTPHSILHKGSGKSSSTSIQVIPAPKGVGIVAGQTSKKVLELVGIKDCWTFTKGRTRNILNMVLATLHALDALNHFKKGRTYMEPEPLHEGVTQSIEQTTIEESPKKEEAPEKEIAETTPKPSKPKKSPVKKKDVETDQEVKEPEED